MSSTRRVESGERRRQNGWASATEFDVLRGLNGTAVAFKATLQDDPAKRELLYFLQALSLREGGLKRFAREFLEMFPERIGSPTMHKLHCKPGKRLTDEQSDAIAEEMFLHRTYEDFRFALGNINGEQLTRRMDIRTAEEWIQVCRNQAEKGLADFIEELCCDPKLEVAKADEAGGAYRGIVGVVLDDARHALENNPRIAKERPHLQTALDKKNDFRFAELLYFSDVLGALFEYQRRYTERAGDDYVETSIGRIVFEAMDYALETGRSALIEGNSGFGKTVSSNAWHAMHLGKAIYVQLSGITTRGAFFKRIARACGVASGGGLSSERVQLRVEEFLRRTKLLLIIDEGQYLWPQGRRITSHPELINWINTALYNERVPFVILATKQFTRKRQQVEHQAPEWSSEQLRRRTRKVFPLPDAPTTEDLKAVARKLLGDLGDSAVDFVVGYAMTARGYFQTITDMIEDAQLIARRAGRERITFKDLKVARDDYRVPSDVALKRVFDSKAESRRGRPRERDYEAPETNRVESMEEPFSPAAASRRSTRPEAMPALTG